MHANVVFVIFDYYMLQNKQSNRHSLSEYDVVGCDIYISYKLEFLDKERSYKQKLYQSSYIVILTDFLNAMNKMLDKISFHKHFKV